MNQPIPRAELERFSAMLAEKRRRLAKAEHQTRGYRDEDGVWQGGLLSFVRYFWHVLEPDTPFVSGWVLEAICLPYQTKITTSEGVKSIGDIVETGWQGTVLSLNHTTMELEWKPIAAHMKSAGKPLVTIRAGSDTISLTQNHPIYTAERGYVRADQVKVGDTLWLHSVQEGISSPPEPKSILQPEMLRRRQVGQGASQALAQLQTLRQRVCTLPIASARWLLFNEMLWSWKDRSSEQLLRIMWILQKLGRKILSQLSRELATYGSNAFLRNVREANLSWASQIGRSEKSIRGVLQHEMYGDGVSWEEQHLLCKRQAGREIPPRVLDRATAGTQAGKELLLSLLQKIKAGCSSYRSKYGKQRTMESSRSVSSMSLRPTRARHSSIGPRHGYEIGWATVCSVERHQRVPDAVYNIEVLDNNNYFAERILVHNCEHLEAVTFGEIKNLLINVFPGAMKSLLTDVFLPAWEWGPMEMPHLRYIAFSYSSGLTERDNEKFRDLMMSNEYQAMYGDQVKLRKIGSTKVSNARHGWKLATSVGGIGTGERADKLLLDDPHNVKESESKVVITETVRWFRESMSDRLNNIDTGSKIVIMQRISEADVSATILDLGFDYTHLCIPMEYIWSADENGEPYTTSIGWVDPRWMPNREDCEGALAWEERFPERAIAKLKKEKGPYAWAAQYSQTPEARGGGLIKRDWWMPAEVYMTNDKFPPLEYVVASLDGAYTEDEQNDPSALTVWGIFHNEHGRNRAMLIHGWAKRLEFSGPKIDIEPGEHESIYRRRCMPHWGLVEWVADTCKRFKVDKLLIESKATGISAAQSLRNSHGREGWTIQLTEPKGDKLARGMAIVPSFSQEMIYAPDRSWAQEVIDQCAKFPYDAHDDLFDSMTQAIKHLRDSGLIRSDEERRAEEMDAVRHRSPPPPSRYPGMRPVRRAV